MADFPIMPVGTSDFLADTAHLSDEEMGLYWRMCLQLWRMPERRFPNDDEWLAKRFGRDAAQVRALVEEFFVSTGNWIKHKRIEREFARVSASCQKQSDRAKSRWNKENSASRGNAGAAMPSTSTSSSSLRSEEESDSPPSVPPSPPPEKALVSRRRSTPAHGSRLPDDWRPSQDDLRFAASVGLSPQEASREAACFSDYWHGRAGEKGRKADWPATWRNWTRRAAERRRQRDGPNRSVLDAQRLTLEAINGSGRYDDDDDREQSGALRTLPWPPAAGRA